MAFMKQTQFIPCLFSYHPLKKQLEKKQEGPLFHMHDIKHHLTGTSSLEKQPQTRTLSLALHFNYHVYLSALFS